MTFDLLELPDSSAFTPAKAEEIVQQFTVKRAYLEKALARIAPVVPTKDNLTPTLKNFNFQILGNLLRISGTDTSLTAIVRIPLQEVKVAGDALFPATRLHTLVRGANGDTVTITVRAKGSKHTAVVQSGRARWTFPLMSPEGFPSFDAIDSVPVEMINREAFQTALSRVRKAASQDVMRPYLMLVDITNGKVRASDSIRFQQVKFQFPFDCQIPVRAAHELANRLASSNLEEIGVAQTENALIFRFGVVTLMCQKATAAFPDVDEVILKPTLANDQELHMDRAALLAAIKRVRVTADENTSAVVLSLNHGSVSVECKDRQGGFSVESIDAEWSHAPRHVSFNHQHLTDLLSSTSSDTCVFRLGKDLKTRPTPLLMEDEETGFVATLSQLRLDWML